MEVMVFVIFVMIQVLIYHTKLIFKIDNLLLHFYIR